MVGMPEVALQNLTSSSPLTFFFLRISARFQSSSEKEGLSESAKSAQDQRQPMNLFILAFRFVFVLEGRVALAKVRVVGLCRIDQAITSSRGTIRGSKTRYRLMNSRFGTGGVPVTRGEDRKPNEGKDLVS